MPVRTGKDKEGCYAQWGKEGKKYYYTCGNERSKNYAEKKALQQGIAVEISKVIEKDK
jgi:hypothetical protein